MLYPTFTNATSNVRNDDVLSRDSVEGPPNEEEGAVIQEDNEDDSTERELKLLQESQGWWFPKTKLSTWVRPPRVQYNGGKCHVVTVLLSWFCCV